MVKFAHGVWFPDKEYYLLRDVQASPKFAGGGTVQFKKFQRAFRYFRGFETAVDVGANCGIWTRVMAHCFDRVICFEPNPDCHDAFWLNNVRGNVTLHKYALGEKEGELTLDISDRKSTAFGHVTKGEGLRVPVYPMDRFEIPSIDFLKIDVEGWEWAVIRGAGETLKRCKPVIIIEQKPGNAERFGLEQYAAVKLLTKMGAKPVEDVSGDIILVW